MRADVAVPGILVLFAVVACGGDVSSGGGPGCGGAPCGGDPVGKWTIVQACYPPQGFSSPDLPPECDGSIRPENLTASGTYEFRPDGTMTFTVTTAGTVVETLSDTCVRALGSLDTPTVACAGFDASFRNFADPASPEYDPAYAAASCAYGNTGCVCRLTRAAVPVTTDSFYSVNGTDLLDGTGEGLGFCVSGDALRLYPKTLDGAGIVLTRTR
ncbi:MAG TPA: hypothetical protein VHE30_23805 [Polyangiaceae bacterium]|nr:hypothetical protein [Polyangiaceae bacterium]